MEKWKINNLDDVTNFAEHLVYVEHLNFHCDTDFADYINNQTGKRTYTADEILTRNDAMKSCFEVCDKCKVDVYEIMGKVLLENYRM